MAEANLGPSDDEPASPERIEGAASAAWGAGALRALCLEAGADDVGFVAIDDPAIAEEREAIEALLPGARTLVGFVCRMNRGPIRAPARSVANLEFHRTGDHVNDAARGIVRGLEERGARAVNPSMGFPMEMERFPGRAWVLSHKKVAVAAGLGRMGIHRNVIHPRFGSFVLLGTVVTDLEIRETSAPLDSNPCFECKLCVAACPVGAIAPDGHFDFAACYTHNYREFMGGFTDWVEQVAESDGAAAYRARVRDDESASMWQSLSFGADYKAAYCIAVCPAGDDVIAPYRESKAGFKRTVVKPLQDKHETVYVVPGSDAERHVAARFPHKTPKPVRGLRPVSIDGFLAALPHVFQRGAAGDLAATYHFRFAGIGRSAPLAAPRAAGPDEIEATVTIRDARVAVQPGLTGDADLRVEADALAWLRFLRGELSIVRALLTRRIRVRGPLRLLRAFCRCFPS